MTQTGIEPGWEDSFDAWVGDTPEVFYPETSVQFGELIEAGYDWGKTAYQSYSMAPETLAWLRPRLNRKIEQRFYYRDIGLTPVARFENSFISILEEALDAEGPIYDQVKNGLDILDLGISESKQIDVDSEFPQALLQTPQKDYASNATQSSTRKGGEGPQLEAMLNYQKNYTESDARILKKLEICFSSFYRSDDF